LNGKHHVSQIKKNWSLIGLILTIVFGAGMVWAFTERDFVEKDTFDVYVTAEKELIEQKFKAHKEHTDLKFKHTDESITHVKEHLEEQKKTLEDIKELLRD